MSKAVAVVVGIVLGLVSILAPTWILVKATQLGRLPGILSGVSWPEDLSVPLLEYSDRNHAEAVTAREVEVLGISFVAASVMYLVFRRRVPRRSYPWLPTHA